MPRMATFRNLSLGPQVSFCAQKQLLVPSKCADIVSNIKYSSDMISEVLENFVSRYDSGSSTMQVVFSLLLFKLNASGYNTSSVSSGMSLFEDIFASTIRSITIRPDGSQNQVCVCNIDINIASTASDQVKIRSSIGDIGNIGEVANFACDRDGIDTTDTDWFFDDTIESHSISSLLDSSLNSVAATVVEPDPIIYSEVFPSEIANRQPESVDSMIPLVPTIGKSDGMENSSQKLSILSDAWFAIGLQHALRRDFEPLTGMQVTDLTSSETALSSPMQNEKFKQIRQDCNIALALPMRLAMTTAITCWGSDGATIAQSSMNLFDSALRQNPVGSLPGIDDSDFPDEALDSLETGGIFLHVISSASSRWSTARPGAVVFTTGHKAAYQVLNVLQDSSNLARQRSDDNRDRFNGHFEGSVGAGIGLSAAGDNGRGEAERVKGIRKNAAGVKNAQDNFIDCVAVVRGVLDDPGDFGEGSGASQQAGSAFARTWVRFAEKASSNSSLGQEDGAPTTTGGGSEGGAISVSTKIRTEVDDATGRNSLRNLHGKHMDSSAARHGAYSSGRMMKGCSPASQYAQRAAERLVDLGVRLLLCDEGMDSTLLVDACAAAGVAVTALEPAALVAATSLSGAIAVQNVLDLQPRHVGRQPVVLRLFGDFSLPRSCFLQSGEFRTKKTGANGFGNEKIEFLRADAAAEFVLMEICVPALEPFSPGARSSHGHAESTKTTESTESIERTVQDSAGGATAAAAESNYRPSGAGLIGSSDFDRSQERCHSDRSETSSSSSTSSSKSTSSFTPRSGFDTSTENNGFDPNKADVHKRRLPVSIIVSASCRAQALALEDRFRRCLFRLRCVAAGAPVMPGAGLPELLCRMELEHVVSVMASARAVRLQQRQQQQHCTSQRPAHECTGFSSAMCSEHGQDEAAAVAAADEDDDDMFPSSSSSDDEHEIDDVDEQEESETMAVLELIGQCLDEYVITVATNSGRSYAAAAETLHSTAEVIRSRLQRFSSSNRSVDLLQSQVPLHDSQYGHMSTGRSSYLQHVATSTTARTTATTTVKSSLNPSAVFSVLEFLKQMDMEDILELPTPLGNLDDDDADDSEGRDIALEECDDDKFRAVRRQPGVVLDVAPLKLRAVKLAVAASKLILAAAS